MAGGSEFPSLALDPLRLRLSAMSEVCPGSFETEADNVVSEFGLGSFQTEADGVMFDVRPGSCETESGGALSEVAKSDDFPVLERLEPRHFRRVLHPRRPAVGSDRASVILHESQSCCTTRTSQNSQTHSLKSHACSLHDVHDARRVQNSMNSVGDGVLRGRCVCVPGGTKVTEYENSVRGLASCCG